jgi:hypothetical protein
MREETGGSYNVFRGISINAVSGRSAETGEWALSFVPVGKKCGYHRIPGLKICDVFSDAFDSTSAVRHQDTTLLRGQDTRSDVVIVKVKRDIVNADAYFTFAGLARIGNVGKDNIFYARFIAKEYSFHREGFPRIG